MARKGDGSVIVAWCPNCEHYFEEEMIGQTCLTCDFHLRKRRGYIDVDSEWGDVYWTKRALRAAREEG